MCIKPMNFSGVNTNLLCLTGNLNIKLDGSITNVSILNRRVLTQSQRIEKVGHILAGGGLEKEKKTIT